MEISELGAYTALLFALWEMPEPGVVPADDRVLARLSRAGGEWANVKLAVSRAFDTESRPGLWVQKRMVATHRQQSGRLVRLVLAGSKGGKAKAEREKASHAIAPAINSDLATPSGTGTGTGTGEEGKGGESSGLFPDSGSLRDYERSARASRRAFVHPSLEEITVYCLERKNSVDPQRFIDHYESNGWRVGKTPMKSWKAAVHTWEANGFETPVNSAGRLPSISSGGQGSDGGAALRKAQADRIAWEKEQADLEGRK